MGLKGTQWKVFLLQKCFKVRGNGEDAITVYPLNAVELVIQDLNRQITHSDLIEVGKANCRPKVPFFGVLLILNIFTADIASRVCYQ